MAVISVELMLDYHIFRELPIGRKEIVENQVNLRSFLSYSTIYSLNNRL